jgi:hypothetical protein
MTQQQGGNAPQLQPNYRAIGAGLLAVIFVVLLIMGAAGYVYGKGYAEGVQSVPTPAQTPTVAPTQTIPQYSTVQTSSPMITTPVYETDTWTGPVTVTVVPKSQSEFLQVNCGNGAIFQVTPDIYDNIVSGQTVSFYITGEFNPYGEIVYTATNYVPYGNEWGGRYGGYGGYDNDGYSQYGYTEYGQDGRCYRVTQYGKYDC